MHNILYYTILVFIRGKIVFVIVIDFDNLNNTYIIYVLKFVHKKMLNEFLF